MKLFSISSFVLFSVFVSLSLSIPTIESHLNEQHVLASDNTPTFRSSSLLTKICGSIVESIWPLYRHHPSKTPKPQVASPRKVQNRYGDDVVLRFKIKTQDEAQAFAEAVETLYLDIWEASQDWADVRVSRKVLPSFLTLLPASMQQSHTPVITSLSQAVLDTYPVHQATQYHRHKPSHGMPHDPFFFNFQPLSVLYPWLRQLAEMFPEKTQLFTIGTSYEGRDIPALRVGFEPLQDDPQDGEPRETVLITAGSHAREWISTSTAGYLLRSLLHSYNPINHDLIDKLLTHYDFVFIPVLNPDGYEYTWTTDRLWRKNRQETFLPFCRGIDLDRAFPFGWNGDKQIENPCSESYAGEHPMQAIEAQRLVEWARNETQDGKRVFKAFIDLHSYSQEILYPYSYTCDRMPHNLEDLEEVATGLAKAFRLTSGHYYSIDSACEGSISLSTPASSKNSDRVITSLEESGGSALDFIYQEMQVKYAFQIKLRDTGSYGFLLPRENIVPTGLETLSAMLGFGRWLLGNRGIENYANMTTDEIWGKEEVIINEFEEAKSTSDDVDDDEGVWWRRRRR